jgi:hypothetical protein
MKPLQVYNQTTQGLPSWAKGVIAVSVIAAVGIVAYKVYKLVSNIGEGKDEKVVLDLVDKEIKEKIKTGDSLSKPLSTYASTANAIEEKLQGCELSAKPEVEVIKLVIGQVKKPIDWLQLTKAFGKRKIDDCGWGSTDYELGNLLKNQLDQYLDNMTGKIVKADNFIYNQDVSGIKTTFDILNIYLKKIGVNI